MKNITFLFVLLLLLTTTSYSQFRNNQWNGSKDNLVTSRGGLKGDSAVIIANFLDTASANNGETNYYPGSIIFTTSDNKFWWRNATAKAWITFSFEISADNGMTTSTPTNVQLGSPNEPGAPLLHFSYINADEYGLYITGTFGYGVFGVSETGAALPGGGSPTVFSSLNNIGLTAWSNNAPAAYLNNKSDNTLQLAQTVMENNANDVHPIFTMYGDDQNQSTDDGFGLSVDYYLRTSDNVNAPISNQLISRWRDATFGMHESEFVVTGRISTDLWDVFTVRGTGLIQGNKYGLGNMTAGTPTYTIRVDANGNFVESPIINGEDTILSLENVMDNSSELTKDHTIFNNNNNQFAVSMGGGLASSINMQAFSIGDNFNNDVTIAWDGVRMQSKLMFGNGNALYVPVDSSQGGFYYQNASGSNRYSFPAHQGGNGQVMKFNLAGQNLYWADIENVTASNGLTKTGSDIKLGGVLTMPTALDLDGKNFQISNNGGDVIFTDGGHITLADASPDANFISMQNVENGFDIKNWTFVVTNRGVFSIMDIAMGNLDRFRIDSTGLVQFPDYNHVLGSADTLFAWSGNYMYKVPASSISGGGNLQSVIAAGSTYAKNITVSAEDMMFLNNTSDDGAGFGGFKVWGDNNSNTNAELYGYGGDSIIRLRTSDASVLVGSSEKLGRFKFNASDELTSYFQLGSYDGDVALMGGNGVPFWQFNPGGFMRVSESGSPYYWELDGSTVTGNRSITIPDTSGTPVMYINGNAPNAKGEITITSSQWTTTGTDSIAYTGSHVDIPNGDLFVLGDITSASNMLGSLGTFGSLHVTGGGIDFDGLSGSHNAADSMLVVASDGTVGFRPIPGSSGIQASDTAAMLSNYLRSNIAAATYVPKSQAAYTMLANNTNATANLSSQVFKEIGIQTLPAETWNGTPPTTLTGNTYTWSQKGKQVEFHFHINYSGAGTSNSIVSFALPSDMPPPLEPTGTGAADNVLYSGFGYITTSLTNTSSVMARPILKVNSGDTGYEISMSVATAVSAKVAYGTITYTAQ